jgi:DNA recombination protein RmuC
VGSFDRQVMPGARKFTELGVRPDKELESVDPVEVLARTPLALDKE